MHSWRIVKTTGGDYAEWATTDYGCESHMYGGSMDGMKSQRGMQGAQRGKVQKLTGDGGAGWYTRDINGTGMRTQ